MPFRRTLALLIVALLAGAALGAGALRARQHVLAANGPVTDGKYVATRSALHRAFPREGRVVMFGDSLVEWADWNAILDRTDIVNRGIGSATTITALQRMDTVLSAKPERVFIMLGMGDIRDHEPVVEIASRYRRIVRKFADNGVAVFVNSVLPTLSNVIANSRAVELNDDLREICSDGPCKFIDLTEHVTENGRLRGDLTEDGLHFNAAGYRIWAAIIKPHINGVTSARP